MAINVTTSKQQIQANVAEDKVTATVSAGFGATGPAGPQGPAGPSYTLPVAGASLGGVKSGGTGITIDNAGVISVTSGAYATLVNGTVPSNQLPSYVDDIIEVANYGSLPSPGETGKIYVDLQTNKVYRWSGFVYIEIVASPGSTDSLAEGSVNLYYTNARASAAAPVQSVAGRTGTVVIAAADIASGTLAAARLPIASAGSLGAVRIGSGISIDGDGVITATAASVAWNDITGKPSTFTPSSHTHGNITNDGKVGTAADKVLITGSAGAVTATSSITYSHVASTSTYTNFSTTPGDLHGALSEIDSALTGKANASDFDQALKTTSVPTFNTVTADGFKVGANKWEVSWQFSGSTLLFSHTASGSEFRFKNDGTMVWPDATIQSTAYTAAAAAAAAPVQSVNGATGAVALTYSDVGAAALSHAHSASDITSGTIDTARLGSGTANSTTYLRGDQTWATVTSGSTSASDLTSGTLADSRLSTNAQAAINLYLWSSFR